MHNLFGRVNEVHIYADEEEPGNFYIEKYIPGTTVTEALSLVQYFPSDLKKRMDEVIRARVRSKQLRPTQGVAFLENYVRGLGEYTYYNFWDSALRPQVEENATGGRGDGGTAGGNGKDEG
jgi:arginine decarboxylase